MSDDEFNGGAMEEDAGDDCPSPAAPAAEELPKGVSKTLIKEAPADSWTQPKAGDEVTVHYVGTLEADGTEFDSSRARGEPFTFTLGKGQVVKGWDLGVATMRKGEVAKLTLAPEFAYGAEGSPPKIPANATLVFEVELLSWVSKVDLFQDGSAIKAIVKEGEGWKKPKQTDEVRLSLRAVTKEGTVVEEKSGLEYAMGSGTLGNFSRAADKVLLGMKKGEEVQLTLSESHAYGEQKTGTVVNLTLEQIYEVMDVSFGKDGTLTRKTIKEGEGYLTPKEPAKAKLSVESATDGAAPLPVFTPAVLEFDVGHGQVCDALELAVADMKKGERAVLTCTTPHLCQDERLGLARLEVPRVVLVLELQDFQRGKDNWKMSDDEKLEYGEIKKEAGSNLFRQGRIHMAMKQYKSVSTMFKYADKLGKEATERSKVLRNACDLNVAACQLKLREYSAAKETCSKVLEEDAKSVKALFRRAQADLELKNFADSARDLKRVLELDPQNADARKRLKVARDGQREEDIRSKGFFAKMCQGLGKGPIPKPGKGEQAEEEKAVAQDAAMPTEEAPPAPAGTPEPLAAAAA